MIGMSSTRTCVVAAVKRTRATSLARNTRWARQWSLSECTYSRWPTRAFELEEKRFTTVDKRGCVRAGTNWYSTPLKPGQRVKLLPLAVEAWRDGRVMAQHERCYDRNRSLYELEHYLDVLERKPGALAGSTPLAQWRAKGRWPASYDELWAKLNRRHGKLDGTRQMVELIQLGASTDTTSFVRPSPSSSGAPISKRFAISSIPRRYNGTPSVAWTMSSLDTLRATNELRRA